MINLRYIYLLGTVLSFLLITACGTSRQLSQTGEKHLPEAFMSNGSLDLDTADNIAELSYRDFFRDKHLVALIDSGLKKNNNMLIAIKQIELAQETMKQVKWGYLPVVDLSVGSASINRSSDNSINGMTASQMTGKKYMEDYSSMLTLSWEADIWGKIKSKNAAALASYLETQEAVNAVRTSLIAGIAQSYYNILMFDEQRQIGHQNLAIIDSTLEITKIQLRLGLTNSLAVQQLENSRDNLLKSIRAIEENGAIQENSLNLLIGNMPEPLENRSRLRELQERRDFATGVPAELISRRPDIKQAELALVRSVSEIDIARVNMYPALRITAQGGLNAFTASNWFSIPGSLFGLVAGSITQPILQGRQLKTEYNQANIRFEQAELQFKESVLQAVSEVSTVLEQISSLQDQQNLNNKLVERNQQLIENSKILFQNDMATYLEILVAQQSKIQAELDQMLVKSQLLYAEVALYKALGGGIN